MPRSLILSATITFIAPRSRVIAARVHSAVSSRVVETIQITVRLRTVNQSANSFYQKSGVHRCRLL